MRTQRNTLSPPHHGSIPTVVYLGWALLCIVVGISLIRSGLQTKSAFRAREKAEEILKEEEAKNAKLRQEIDTAKDAFSQERMIRDELNLQKPGETILLLPSPTP